MNKYREELSILIYRHTEGSDSDLPIDEYVSEAEIFLNERAEKIESPNDANIELTKIMANSMGWDLTEFEQEEGIYGEIADSIFKIVRDYMDFKAEEGKG